MKVNADYNLIHRAIDSIKLGIPLEKSESKELVLLLNAVQGDYIPTKEEIAKQEVNIELINTIDIDKNREQWDRVYNQCRDFENKYC